MKSLRNTISDTNARKYKNKLNNQKKQYKNEMQGKLNQFYNRQGIVDVHYPIWPTMKSGIVLALPKKGTQKYVLLHRAVETQSMFDIVSLPLEYHKEISSKYVQMLLPELETMNQFDITNFPFYLPVGGSMKTDGKNNLHISSFSGDFSCNMLGFDSNAITAHILEETGQFNSVTFEPNNNLKINTNELFDMIEQTYIDCDNDMYIFVNKLADMHAQQFSHAHDMSEEKMERTHNLTRLWEIHMVAGLMMIDGVVNDYYKGLVLAMKEVTNTCLQKGINDKINKP